MSMPPTNQRPSSLTFPIPNPQPQTPQAIDRTTGAASPALLALHALVSPCRRFLAMVIMILPLGASGARHHHCGTGGGKGFLGLR